MSFYLAKETSRVCSRRYSISFYSAKETSQVCLCCCLVVMFDYGMGLQLGDTIA